MIARRVTRQIVLRSDEAYFPPCIAWTCRRATPSRWRGAASPPNSRRGTRERYACRSSRDRWVISRIRRGLAVKRNAFGAQTIAFVGGGYARGCRLRRPRGDVDDAIRFEDGPLGVERSVAFTMSNVSEKLAVRVAPPTEGTPTECFSFSPRVGHLHAGCAKTITVTFVRSNPPRTEATRRIRPLEIGVSLAPIVGYFPSRRPAAEGEAPAEPTVPVNPVDWDDAKTTRRTVVVEPERPGWRRERRRRPGGGVRRVRRVRRVQGVHAASVKTTVVFDPCPSRRSRRTRREPNRPALRFRRGG